MVRATPEVVGIIHGIDERIAVDDYLMAIRFYYAFMQRVSE